MSLRIGVVGLGKFGAAFLALARRYGHAVRGFDPQLPTESVASLAALIADCEVVVLAVPVTAMRAALATVAPLLRTGQLIVDVCSVKVEPERHLREVLGAAHRWAATHPLFGPVSLSRGEAQTVIVCPRPDAPESSGAAGDLFRSVGCSVVEVSAEEHDRVMARTHVLAFFVAKALQEIGAASAPFAPPSFQSMARVVDLVREDAGHLFEAIQIGNPFAHEAREALIGALTRIHADIGTG